MAGAAKINLMIELLAVRRSWLAAAATNKGIAFRMPLDPVSILKLTNSVGRSGVIRAGCPW
jgi:hypothetical protein